MTTVDPMAAAVDRLDAYRAASLTIVSMYSGNASLECRCDGQQVLTGHQAITEDWRQRFSQKPAGELVDLRPDGDAIVVSYRVPAGIVRAVLRFDETGRIKHSSCGLNHEGLDPCVGPTIRR